MTYKEIKQLGLTIPKGWRKIRMGEQIPRNYKYINYETVLESKNKNINISWRGDGTAMGRHDKNRSFRIKQK